MINILLDSVYVERHGSGEFVRHHVYNPTERHLMSVHCPCSPYMIHEDKSTGDEFWRHNGYSFNEALTTAPSSSHT